MTILGNITVLGFELRPEIAIAVVVLAVSVSIGVAIRLTFSRNKIRSRGDDSQNAISTGSGNITQQK